MGDVYSDYRAVVDQNERLAVTLREARTQIIELQQEVNRLAEPPSGLGIFLHAVEDGTAYVSTAGREMRVQVSPEVEIAELAAGQKVVLNEALNIVATLGYETIGEIVTFKRMLADGERALIVSQADENQIARLADPLRGQPLGAGDSLLLERRSGYLYERIPAAEVADAIIEESDGVAFADIGALDQQIEKIRDAVEMPNLHTDLFRRYQLLSPKGLLLHGPPGCGKTLVINAIANSLARQAETSFLRIHGTKLLSKYIGETERHIRLVFQNARLKASAGGPVIVFFDDMDSLFRSRGGSAENDLSNTVVPQLLSEIDSISGLGNVVVIGATNREDMIDPAVLSPGRFDVKIRFSRPDSVAASDIFARYLTVSLPLHRDELTRHDGMAQAAVAAMIASVVERMYSEREENNFAEVTYASGDKELLYFRDFNSGAKIRNIVDRAKRMAIKEDLRTGEQGLRTAHLLAAFAEEVTENSLSGIACADDWARISGRKGERIVYIRTVATYGGEFVGRSIEPTERPELSGGLNL